MTREQRTIADRERPRAVCQRRLLDPDHSCDRPLEVSHPLGRKVQYRWMWLWSCRRTHRGDFKNNEKDLFIVLQQATEEDIKLAFPKTYPDLIQKKKYLTSKYGSR